MVQVENMQNHLMSNCRKKHQIHFIQTWIGLFAHELEHITEIPTHNVGRHTQPYSWIPPWGGQTVHDRWDKGAVSPQSVRQAATKDKSIKGEQSPWLLDTEKAGYITWFTVAKKLIERRRMFLLSTGSTAFVVQAPQSVHTIECHQ